MRNAHTRACDKIKKFIASSCDNGFLCSNMRIEANRPWSDMELQNSDFLTQGERHEGKRKLVPQMRNAHRRTREKIKIFIASSYYIGFFCSNMRIKPSRASYDMELKKHDFESRDVRHEEKSKLIPRSML